MSVPDLPPDDVGSFWSRVFYPRDWFGLAREHVRGAVQVAVAVFVPTLLASWGLGWLTDRAADSDKDREALIDRLAAIDRWVDRARTVAVVLLVAALIVAAAVWLVDRKRAEEMSSVQ